jgi:signal transduction histidine kinase
VSRIRPFRTTSFRLTAIYLLLFTASALALGTFIYVSVRREILADLDEGILEESQALKRIFAEQGRERLAAALDARGAGGALEYGLEDRDGKKLAGELEAPRSAAAPRSGWAELIEEADDDEAPGAEPESLRALMTPLADGSTLIVGAEHRADEAQRGILATFGWAVGATIALGALGGLWVSARFLRRIDAMRFAARGIMAGDWGRRIPPAPVDDDLSALAATFNRLFDRIEKLLLANKRVSTDIAHDLRKPLARMLRLFEAARGQGASSAAAADAIEAAIAEIKGVLETFDALLRVGQIEAGARRAAFCPLDLAQIAGEVVEAFQPAAEEAGRMLSTRLEAPMPMLGDKELLTQMIANLIDNAITHTPAGVRIEVAGERMAQGMRLTVADNGPGAPPGGLEAIFQPFYRGDSARTSPGSGLGLSIVAAIAELHGLDCSASDNSPGLKVTLETAAPQE